MAIKIDGSGVMTFNDNSTQATAFDMRYTGRRNMVMNALHLVNQRGSTAVNNGGQYISDRWRLDAGTAAVSLELNSVASVNPSLYGATYTRLRANAAQPSPTATQYAQLQQGIEGTLMGRLLWGTANAKPVTLSFRASANIAGNMSFSIRNAANNRSYVGTVALTTTTQRFVVTIPGDTTGTWEIGSNWGCSLSFLMCIGSSYSSATKDAWQAGNIIGHTSQTNFAATLNNEIRIADVQLEAGSVDSPLEIVEYQDELIRCMRYYQQGNYIWRGYATINITYGGTQTFKTDMRVAPTVTTAWNSAVGFPQSNAGINGTQTWHFDISKVANGTGGGIFADDWNAMADFT